MLFIILQMEIPFVFQCVLSSSSSDGVCVSLLLSSNQLGIDLGIHGISKVGINLSQRIMKPHVSGGALLEVLRLDNWGLLASMDDELSWLLIFDL